MRHHQIVGSAWANCWGLIPPGSGPPDFSSVRNVDHERRYGNEQEHERGVAHDTRVSRRREYMYAHDEIARDRAGTGVVAVAAHAQLCTVLDTRWDAHANAALTDDGATPFTARARLADALRTRLELRHLAEVGMQRRPLLAGAGAERALRVGQPERAAPHAGGAADD